MAEQISSSFLPKCRKSVTSFTPASLAMRRVLAALVPPSANSFTVERSSASRTSLGRPSGVRSGLSFTYLPLLYGGLGAGWGQAGRKHLLANGLDAAQPTLVPGRVSLASRAI